MSVGRSSDAPWSGEPTVSFGTGWGEPRVSPGMVLCARRRSVSKPEKNENDKSTPNVVGLRLSTHYPLTQDATKGKRARARRLPSGDHTASPNWWQWGFSTPRAGVPAADSCDELMGDGSII